MLLKVIILNIQNILEALPQGYRNLPRKPIFPHNVTIIISSIFYVVIHYPITLLNLAFQLPLNQMTVFNPLLSLYSVYGNIVAYEY